MTWTMPIEVPPRYTTPSGTPQQNQQAEFLADELKNIFDWVGRRGFNPEHCDLISVSRMLIQKGDVKYIVDATEGNLPVAKIDVPHI